MIDRQRGEPIAALGNERRDERCQPIGRAIAKGAAVGQRINRFQSFEVCSQHRSTQIDAGVDVIVRVFSANLFPVPCIANVLKIPNRAVSFSNFVFISIYSKG